MRLEDRLRTLWSRVPTPLVFAVAILPAALAIGIFGFIARYAIAHDERVCPFEERAVRTIADARIREEARQCIPEVEEHRWILVRRGRELEMGRFPLEAELVSEGFPWSLALEEDRVVLTVMNEGRGEIIFREPVRE